jgi:hypothetical protein
MRADALPTRFRAAKESTSMRAPRLVRVGTEQSGAAFSVYVEGARDRDLLAAWARRLSPPLARALEPACVILGGRQPARAAGLLARRRELQEDAAGLCVLDGDAIAVAPPPACDGLEYFIWSRRHIESYLLVPAAIERAARTADMRLRRLLEAELPDPGDERALRSFDAKRFLGEKGPLARFLGRTLSPGAIARAMRDEEIHEEVRALFARIAAGLGILEPEVAVHRRPATAGRSEEV